jgi:hypothetical protein
MRSENLKRRTLLVWRGHPCPRNACSKITQAGSLCRRSLVALFALLTALIPWAEAQRTAAHAVAPRPAVSRFHSPTGTLASRQNAYPSRFLRSSPYTSLPFPFYGDSFNPDDIYSTGYPVASQPPVFLLQAARAMTNSTDYLAPAERRHQPSPQPLVIELQNGRYVRIHSTPANGEVLPSNLRSNDARPAKSTPSRSNSAPAIAPAPPAHDLPPAVLVFRDGHSEEVRDYTIADGILYARGNYYTNGYWNKKIELSTLNVAQTLQANTTRNVKFVLPASPNEVITRP